MVPTSSGYRISDREPRLELRDRFLGNVLALEAWRSGAHRAESARQDAERHLEVASSIIGHLEDIVMGSLTDTVQLQGAGLDRTITLLREQVAKVRKSRGFSLSLLFSLGPINWEIACRLRKSGRYDEALILLREQNDLLSQCLEQDPANEEYRWEAANTLRNAGMIEIDFQRYDEALDYLDQATELVIGTDSDHPRRQHLISHLSHAYHQLGDLSDRNGHPHRSKACKEWAAQDPFLCRE